MGIYQLPPSIYLSAPTLHLLINSHRPFIYHLPPSIYLYASYGSEPSFGKLGPIPPIAFERPKSGRGHQKLCNSWNLINTTHLESFVAAAIVNTVLDDDE